MGDVNESVHIEVTGADGLAEAAAEAKLLDAELKKVRDAAAEAGAAGESLGGLRDKLAETAVASDLAAHEMRKLRSAGAGGGLSGSLGAAAKEAEGLGAALANLGTKAASQALSPGNITAFGAGAALIAPALLAATVEATALTAGLAAAGTGLGAFAALAAPTFGKIKNGYQSISTAQAAYTKAQTLARVSPTKSNIAAEARDAAKLKAAYAGIPASIRPAVRGVEQLKTEYSKMATAFQPDALKVFNGGLKIANEMLPHLKPFADTAATAVSGLLGHLGRFLQTSHKVFVPGHGGGGRMLKEQTPFGAFLQQFHALEGPSIKAFGKGIGQVGTSFGKLLTTLKPATVVRGIGLAFGAVSGTLRGFAYVVRQVHTHWNQMTEGLGHSYGNVHHAADNIGHAFTNVHHAMDNVGHAGSNVVHAFSNIGHAISNVGHAGSNVSHAFDNIKHAYANVSHALTPGAIGKGLAGVGKSIAGAFDGAVAAVKGKISAIVSTVSGLGGKIGSAIGNLSGSLTAKGAALIGGLVSGIKSKIGSVVSAVASIGGRLGGALSNFGGLLVSKGAALITGLLNGIQSMAGSAVSFMAGLPGKLESAIGNLGGALVSVGAQLISGLISGIESMAGAAVSAASGVVGGAISAAKSLLGIHSPSKVFHKIGQQTIEGWILGMEGGKGQVQAAMNAVLGVKPFSDSTISKTVKSLRKEIQSAFEHGKITGFQKLTFTQLLEDDNARLMNLAHQRQRILSQIRAAEALAKSVTAAAIAGADITQIAPNTQAGIMQASEAEGAPGTAQNPYQNIQQGLQGQLSQIKQFRADIIRLKKEGLDKTSIKQLLAAGVSGGGLSTAEQLLGGGAAGVKQVASLQKQIDAASKKLGITGANAAYESGADIGKGLAAGLKSELKGIDKAMSQIARTLVASLMAAMGASKKAIREALAKLDKELGTGGGGSGHGGGGHGKLAPPHTPPVMHVPVMQPMASSGGATVTRQPIVVNVVLDGKVLARSTQQYAMQHARRNPATYPQLPGR